MGCRPSRHSLGKVGDSTWEYNKVYMNDMDKKKHKNKRSGRGRGRKHPTYSDFSSTSKTYYNNRECKSSKITVRLSTDGSMLEIETFDVDLPGTQATEVAHAGTSSRLTVANVHTSRSDKKTTLQRCESAPELIGKPNSEPVVWKSWTKVPTTDTAPDKFTCIETHPRRFVDDGTVLTEMGDTDSEEHIAVHHIHTASRPGSRTRDKPEDKIATPEADQICDMFLKKAMARQGNDDYKSPRTDHVSSPCNTHLEDNKQYTCSCRPNINSQIDHCTILSEADSQNIISSERFTSNTPCTCAKCQLNAIASSDPAHALCCETLTYLVLYGTPTGAPSSTCCCLCRVPKLPRHTPHLSSSDLTTDRIQPTHPGQYRGGRGSPFIYEQTNSEVKNLAQPVCSQSKSLINNIDRNHLQNRSDVPSNSKPISSGVLCNENGNPECQVPLLNHLFDLSSLAKHTHSDISHRCANNPHIQTNTCHFNETVAMTTNGKMMIQDTSDRPCDLVSRAILDNRTTGGTDNECITSRWSCANDGDRELYYGRCGKYLLDSGPLNTYNMDFLDDVSEGEMEEEQDGSEDDYEYESSDKDDDVVPVDLQDPFDNIPKITRAYEGYSVIYDDDVDDNSFTDEDDSSEEVYIDAVESSYV